MFRLQALYTVLSRVEPFTMHTPIAGLESHSQVVTIYIQSWDLFSLGQLTLHLLTVVGSLKRPQLVT